MATLKDIRKRVKSVESTEKITKAMKMVAASKLRKAQNDVKMSRPYFESIKKLVFDISMKLEEDGGGMHPFFEQRKEKNTCLLVFTSDKGLCGGLNSYIIRRTYSLYSELSKESKVFVCTIGKKGNEAFKRADLNILKDYPDILNNLNNKVFSHVADDLCLMYLRKDFDNIYILYNEFISALSQKLILKKILPIFKEKNKKNALESIYEYEPNKNELLNALLPKYFLTIVYQGALESIASEHGARMTAMDNATKNASEMIDSLKLQYNRARQATITRELIEIIGGAEALGG
jgi:F-type H+-transporting ATPase subunit gamma